MFFTKFIPHFFPQQKEFYALFEDSSANLIEITRTFSDLLNAPQDMRDELHKRIVDLEHVGDEITHEIFSELRVNFLTPFDQEDITYLATSLDDIADFVFAVSKKMLIYKVHDILPVMKEISRILELCAQEIHEAILQLKEVKSSGRLQEAIVRINSLENEADDLYEKTITELFAQDHDAIKLIKLQEILSNMEAATDKCEAVAHVLETIFVKNS